MTLAEKRAESHANKYVEQIREAQYNLLRLNITKDEFILTLKRVEHEARMDSDILETEYTLIKMVSEVAGY